MIWEDFLNSQWYDWRGSGASEDRLELPSWRTYFIDRHRLGDPGAPTEDELSIMRQLRDRLRDITAAIHQAAHAAQPSDSPVLSAAELALLNETFSSHPYTKRLELENGSLTLVEIPMQGGWEGILAQVVASYGNTLADGDLERFRICDNPDCRWIYYDTTRNRSKRYCDDKCCGNLLKVRRFRERAKTAQAATDKRKKDDL